MSKSYIIEGSKYEYMQVIITFFTDKRVKMALNSSPEFKSLNPKPSAAEVFGTIGHHLS